MFISLFALAISVTHASNLSCPAMARLSAGYAKYAIQEASRTLDLGTKIEKVYSEAKSAEEADAKSVQIYLEARFADAPAAKAAEAREILQSHTLVETITPTFKKPIRNLVAYNAKDYRRSKHAAIAIAIPPRYADTAICNAVKIHELEEVILKESWQDVKVRTVSDALDQIRIRFYTEKNAITAEWTYLHSLPASRRQQLLAMLEQDKESHPDFLEMFKRQLTNASLTLPEYLKSELAPRGYSVSEIAKATLKPLGNNTISASELQEWFERDVLLTAEEREELKTFLTRIGRLGPQPLPIPSTQ